MEGSFRSTAVAEQDVEPTFWADVRGEALWDTLSLWVTVVAGLLLIADHGWWPYFGLVGGRFYLYFAGRGIVTRLAMARQGLRIGAPQDVRLDDGFSAVWGVMALVLIATAISTLE